MNNWTEATVIDVHHWDPSLFTLLIKSDKLPKYQAGQFIQLGLEIDGNIVSRAYSFANAPHDNMHYFVITDVDGGKLSPRLSSLKYSDKVLVSNRINGQLTIESAPQNKRLIMIGTGTGVTPFFSIMLDKQWNDKFKEAHVYHSVSSHRHLCHQTHQASKHQDLAYLDHYDLDMPCDIQEALNYHSSYTPSVTQELGQFANKRLTEQVLSGQIKLNSGTDTVMLCGNPHFIEEMEAILLNKGFSHYNRRTNEGNILKEAYWAK